MWADEIFGTTGSPVRAVVDEGLRTLAINLAEFARLMAATESTYWHILLSGCSLTLELSGAVVVATLRNELTKAEQSTINGGGPSVAGQATT
jgi:hypothetical protein